MEYVIVTLVKAAVFSGALLLALLYLQWIERKVIAHVQLRLGPWRVGPHGLLQPIADVVKLLTKEDLMPAGASRFLFVLAPFLAVFLALIPVAFFPFGPEVEIFGVRTHLQLADLNIGILFLLAVSSLGVYGIALAGWSSNSKYSLLGGLRSSAQMVSYELPLALAIVAPLLLANTLSLRELADFQSGYYAGWIPRWNIFHLPAPQILGFVIFLIAAFAETNRIPFDLPEAENELVAGFHTEYSSLKFASFFMAEYANIITGCALATVLFLGAWNPLWPESKGSAWFPGMLFAAAGAVALYHGLHPAHARDRRTLPIAAVAFWIVAAVFLLPPLKPVLLPVFWFCLKAGLLIFFFIWVRATLPRFRYDQLMRFCWKVLFPVAMVNLLVTGWLVADFGG